MSKVRAKAKPTKVYKYGALPPTNEQEVLDIVYQRHAYKNQIIENDRARRKEVSAAIEKEFPLVGEWQTHIDELSIQIDEVRQQIKDVKKKARKSVKTPELSAKVKGLIAERKELNSVKPTQKEMYSCKAVKAIEEKYIVIKKKSRADSNLYWGSYGSAEDDLRDIRKGKPADFQRFNKAGCISVQVQKPNSLEQVLAGENSHCQILPHPKNADSKNSGRLRILKIRISRDQTEFAYIPFIFHRPLPVDCNISWAKVFYKTVGTRREWNVQFSLNRPVWPRHNGEGKIAIDIGWRKQADGGVRIAYWSDSHRHGAIIIPADQIARLNKADDIRSTCDTNFNTCIKNLVQWKEELLNQPDWFVEQTARLSQWKSQARLAKVVGYWRSHRFEGDTEAFGACDAWRKHDKHLLNWETGCRERFYNWRNNFYRELARNMADKYACVILEDFDTHKAVQKAKPEEEETKNYGRSNKQKVAVSTFLGYLIEVMDHVKIKPEYTSKQCHNCGHICNLEAEPEFTCPKCSLTWDRDYNASVNILTKGGGEIFDKETHVQGENTLFPCIGVDTVPAQGLCT